MTKGLKVWLIIVIAINALSIIGSLLLGSMFAVVLGVAIIIGAILILRMKKLGLYVICISAIAAFILNLNLGTNIALSFISMILSPLIIYLLMRKNWTSFD